MKHTDIFVIQNELNSYDSKKVTLCGWVKSIRSSSNVGFIDFNDGTSFKGTQVVFEKDKVANYNNISSQNIGASLMIKGVVKLTPDAKQPYEINAYEIAVLGESSSDFPLQKKRHTVEYLRTIPHLRPRTNLINAAFRVRSMASFAVHKYFFENNFIYAHTPIITANDGEGAGEMFNVSTLDLKKLALNDDGSVDYTKDFFNKAAHLTVTGQLEGEAMANAFQKIYTFGPTFRAEKSNTTRHAAEFWMIEPEIVFADLNDNINLIEDLIKYITKFVMENCVDEIDFFNTFVDKTLIERLETTINSSFIRVSYTDAIDILQKSGIDFKFKVSWGIDIQTEHEKYLAEIHYKKPVFITDYPKDIKAFYMRLNDDNKTVAATDLVVAGVGELVGASQREERYDYLIQALKDKNLKEKDYHWYLELRKYGGTTQSGFGIGFERLIMYLTGIKNIRETIPFPRTPGNLV